MASPHAIFPPAPAAPSEDKVEIPRPSAERMSVLVGLIGRSIALSQSPRMHEREGLRLGLNSVYRRLDFDVLGKADADLPAILDQCELLGFSGVNVTHPFKQAVLAHLDGLSPEAQAIGAVNTVVFRDGQRIGYNTDCWGFAESFREGLPGVARNRVVLVGAGGAGRAVLQALIDLGFDDVAVVDNDAEAATRLAASVAARVPTVSCAASSDLAAAVARADGVVNATPLGMGKYPGLAIPLDAIAPHQWVADIVYFPEETALIAGARAKGCPVLRGGGMAVHQAARAFELFSGIRPDAAEMARTRMLS